MTPRTAPRDIPESDWKVFRELRTKALEFAVFAFINLYAGSSLAQISAVAARQKKFPGCFDLSWLACCFHQRPIQILLCKPRPDHSQRENTGQERGEAQRYVVEADMDEGMHIAGYDENPCQ